MKKTIFLTMLLAAFFVSAALADPGDTLWTRMYGGTGQDEGRSVQQTTDGGYIIGGKTTSFGAGTWNFYLLKTDANGDTLWTRTYGGYDCDQLTSVQQTTDGGYIIGGGTYSFGNGLSDVYVVKTDSIGDTLWTRTHGGSGNDASFCARQTSDGGYIIVGTLEKRWPSSSFGKAETDIWLIKMDANGNSPWTRCYGGSGDEEGFCVRQTSDEGYIIAGYTRSFGAGLSDVYLVKTDASGNTLWTRTYGGSDYDNASSVQQTTDGGYIVAGRTTSFGAGKGDAWLLKTDANGDTLWTRTYGDIYTENGQSVQQTIDGGYIVAGTVVYNIHDWDVYLLKTDANGETLWTRTYGGWSHDMGWCVQQTTDGGYIVAGNIRPVEGEYPVAPFPDVWLLKLAGEELPAVSIEIIPDDPLVTVPQGGSFGYTGTVTNNTEDPQVTDIWVMAVGPLEGVYGPFKEFHDIPLAPSQSRSRHLTQGVPNAAPLGFYNYIAYCGDYPSTVMDSSYFQVEVIAGPAGGATGWVLTGSFLEGDLADLPSDFALLSNYPNPFNAQTVIEYQLPSAGEVKLEIYNLLGSKVATLMNGEQEAGYRSVTWDASEISSGIYFYKLTAGDYTETRRMMLVK